MVRGEDAGISTGSLLSSVQLQNISVCGQYPVVPVETFRKNVLFCTELFRLLHCLIV